ncbi:MAG TPA: transcriptional regulator, partial [Marinobacter hydrocarbonoclasticus]|nr:transcriptional regulator [Marinobacter nauticus]
IQPVTVQNTQGQPLSIRDVFVPSDEDKPLDEAQA